MHPHSFPCGNSELFTEDKEAECRVGETKGSMFLYDWQSNYFLSTYHWSEVFHFVWITPSFSYCIISLYGPMVEYYINEKKTPLVS